MTVWFGGTVADFTVNLANQIVGSGSFTVYSDAACTTPASGLVNEASASIGSTVTARASGVYRFGAPDGTTVLYLKDSAGLPVWLYPTDPAVAAAGYDGGVDF